MNEKAVSLPKNGNTGLEKWQAKKFEDIKHLDENKNEYWLARELQSVLGYAQWRRFCDAIDRAMASCKLNEQEPEYHFADVGKTQMKEILDYRLTRFACYLIVMNGNPRKEAIEVAKRAGIQTTYEYAAFTDKGYMGLYDGLKAKDIAKRKGIGKINTVNIYVCYIIVRLTLFKEFLWRTKIIGLKPFRFMPGKKIQTLLPMHGRCRFTKPLLMYSQAQSLRQTALP
jgi:hypothetical protein